MGELTSREGRESSEDAAPNGSFCPHRLPCSGSEVMEPMAQVMLCAAQGEEWGRHKVLLSSPTSALRWEKSSHALAFCYEPREAEMQLFC